MGFAGTGAEIPLWRSLRLVAVLILAPGLVRAQGGSEADQPSAPPDAVDATAPAQAPEPVVDGAASEEAAAPEVADESEPETITVWGRSAASELRRSAYTVTVLDTEQARRLSADLGDVLARETPVTVQRAGGLGSRGSYALGGMGGERLRFFLDSVPLELMGYMTGPGNVPVDLVDRVEVYQGMVPVRLASDALGGAVNLVTDQNVARSSAAASYQLGSFGTHRATLATRYVHHPSGLFVRASGFFDTAENDYPVDVETWDDVGRLRPTTVPLFHNGYRGKGATVALGVADRPWAGRLVVQGFFSAFDNDVQNGLSMSQPYGEVTLTRGSSGVSLKYAGAIGAALHFDAIGGYAHTDARFTDLSRCLYDWQGDCTPRAVESIRGEMSGRPVDRAIVSDIWFFRPMLAADLDDSHQLRVTLAPTHTNRRGENKTRSQDYDPLAQPRRLFTGVIGAEFDSRLFDDDVKNILSLKGYMLTSDSQQLLPTGSWQDMSQSLFHGGVGDSLHVRLSDVLSAKASYEYALRFPSADELYGDGDAVLENLELRPETSHNINAGLAAGGETPIGRLSAAVDGFARISEDFIAPLATVDFVRNVNIWDARALGVEARVGWTVPGGDWLSLDGRFTYQDLRNLSDDGDLAEQSGDRIPSIPYLFADAGARLRGTALLLPGDTTELAWSTRYVHGYLRGWESLARNADRLEIDSQLTHRLSLMHAVELDWLVCTATVEVQNLTDERVFDFYGLQRPGRSFHTKVTVQF